jgi:hypothetical protein
VTHLALSTNEPVVTITVPVRLLPQLVAILAAAVTPASKPCVETTGEAVAESRPGLAKVLPFAAKLKRLA